MLDVLKTRNPHVDRTRDSKFFINVVTTFTVEKECSVPSFSQRSVWTLVFRGTSRSVVLIARKKKFQGNTKSTRKH